MADTDWQFIELGKRVGSNATVTTLARPLVISEDKLVGRFNSMLNQPDLSDSDALKVQLIQDAFTSAGRSLPRASERAAKAARQKGAEPS